MPARRSHRGRCLATAAALAAAAGLLCPGAVAAQELEPRSYSPSPVGANFAVAGYGHSWGSLLFDPAVPITDARASIHGTVLGYGRTFAIGGAQALATVVWPYAWGEFSGKVFGTDSSTTRSGGADLKAKLSVNLVGSPAMSPAEFARTPGHRLVAGASVTVSAPTGQYFPGKLLNIGTNRWAFKPELGVSYRVRPRWTAEGYVGAWFFTGNESFYPGSARRTQDPLTSVQAHLSYTIAPRSWAALDGTWYGGGSSSTNGGPASTRLSNHRLGAVLAVGVTPRQSLKLGYSFGAATRVGDDFGTLAAAWQVLWF
jgi:hypothetical protein